MIAESSSSQVQSKQQDVEDVEEGPVDGETELKQQSTVLLEEEEGDAEGDVEGQERQGGGSEAVPPMEQGQASGDVEAGAGKAQVAARMRRKAVAGSVMSFAGAVLLVILVLVFHGSFTTTETDDDYEAVTCLIRSGGVKAAFCAKADCVPGVVSEDDPNDVPCSKYDFNGEQVQWNVSIGVMRDGEFSEFSSAGVAVLYGDCFKESDSASARREEDRHRPNTTVRCFYNWEDGDAQTILPPSRTKTTINTPATVAVVATILTICALAFIVCTCKACYLHRIVKKLG